MYWACVASTVATITASGRDCRTIVAKSAKTGPWCRSSLRGAGPEAVGVEQAHQLHAIGVVTDEILAPRARSARAGAGQRETPARRLHGRAHCADCGAGHQCSRGYEEGSPIDRMSWAHSKILRVSSVYCATIAAEGVSDELEGRQCHGATQSVPCIGRGHPHIPQGPHPLPVSPTPTDLHAGGRAARRRGATEKGAGQRSAAQGRVRRTPSHRSAHRGADGRGGRGVRTSPRPARGARRHQVHRFCRSRSDDVRHRRSLPQGAALQALQEDDPELHEGEGDFRLLCEAVLSSGRAVRYLAVHSVPVRHRRLLRPRAQDAEDHHDEVQVLLREGLQLRHGRRRRAGREGRQVGWVLRHLVVSRGPAGPGAPTREQDPRLPARCSRW